ncbi:MAG TPA: hypothetical protein VN081_05770 [Dongiaceae bacterium]|nr:hypothetical protein [Dongiaceae bacterium]
MTHTVILYVLMILTQNGQPMQRTYHSYNDCLQAKEQWEDLARRSHESISAKCVPEQRSEKVEH